MKKVQVQILIPTNDVFGETIPVMVTGIIRGNELFISQTDAACPCSEDELRDRIANGDSASVAEEYRDYLVPSMKIDLDDPRIGIVGIKGKRTYQFVLDDEFKNGYRVDRMPNGIM